MRDNSKTAAYYFAYAALAFAKGDTAGGNDWVKKADEVFPAEETDYFYKSLMSLGWLQAKTP